MRPVVPRIVNSVSYVTRISHDSHFAWQAQYLVKFKCHFSWQGQYSVKFGMIAARHAHFLLNVPVSISSSSKPKDPKPNDDPDEDETDPQAGPSSGPPILPVDDDEQQNQNDEKSDTVEYNSAPEGITDSDDTVDYQDLVINDDASWSLLTQEQRFVPTLDHLVFQDTLIIHQLMSCMSVPRTSMMTDIGHTVAKRMCAETTPISRRFMIS